MNDTQHQATGKLAKEYCGKRLPLQVLQSHRGFYIGTFDEEGPCSRESEEYFAARPQAETAMAAGQWTQKQIP